MARDFATYTEKKNGWMSAGLCLGLFRLYVHEWSHTQIIARQKFLCIFPGTIICPGSVQLRARDIKWRLLASHATCIITDANTAETVDQVKMKYSIIIFYSFTWISEKKGRLASICATCDWVRNTWNLQWILFTHTWSSFCILMDAGWFLQRCQFVITSPSDH